MAMIMIMMMQCTNVFISPNNDPEGFENSTINPGEHSSLAHSGQTLYM